MGNREKMFSKICESLIFMFATYLVPIDYLFTIVINSIDFKFEIQVIGHYIKYIFIRA